ncbi:hypothetical protein [Dictyobacter halimunensis]|uniref:hypothetical protein n=1 Tax=Dictyobacter halimunensis TaxID=3026934 RepID=UPI0030C68436
MKQEHTWLSGPLDLQMWRREVKEAQVHGRVMLSPLVVTNGGRPASLHIEVSATK